MFIEYIFLLCWSGCAPPQGERDRKPTTAELEPQGTSVSVVNAARGDQSSVIRYDYQIYPSVSPGRDLKYIIKYNQRYNAISVFCEGVGSHVLCPWHDIPLRHHVGLV